MLAAPHDAEFHALYNNLLPYRVIEKKKILTPHGSLIIMCTNSTTPYGSKSHFNPVSCESLLFWAMISAYPALISRPNIWTSHHARPCFLGASVVKSHRLQRRVRLCFDSCFAGFSPPLITPSSVQDLVDVTRRQQRPKAQHSVKDAAAAKLLPSRSKKSCPCPKPSHVNDASQNPGHTLHTFPSLTLGTWGRKCGIMISEDKGEGSLRSSSLWKKERAVVFTV